MNKTTEGTVAGTAEVGPKPKLGIENLKKVVKIAMQFINMGDKMGHENNWTARMGHLFGFIPSLMSLSSIEGALIGPEIKDVDPVEYAELKVFFKTEFDIVDDKLEEVIEEVLELVANAGSVVMGTFATIKKIKMLLI